MAKPRKRAAQARHHVHGDRFEFKPKSQVQAEAYRDFTQGRNLVLIGSAGAGKTYLGAALGVEMLESGEIDQILFFRSAVQARNIGFLPGNEAEKMAAFETSVREQINAALKRGDGYDILKQKGMVHFQSTSFQRGNNYRHSLMVVDEIQNCSWQELYTIVTRAAEGTRIILCGDTKQTDLTRDSGFGKLMRVMKHLEAEFAVHRFTLEDCVRGPLVKAFLGACEKEFGNEVDF